jgi:hypothetical protein
MLGGERDARGPELLSLKAPHEGGDQVGGQARVLAERLAEASPARLGRDVRRRMVGAADSHGHVLLRGDPRELLDQGGIASGREAERGRPLRERARRFRDPESCADAVVVARVRHEEDGRPQAAGLGHLLNGVEPRRHRPRVRVLAVDELNDVPLVQRVRRSRRDQRDGSAAEGVGPIDRLLADRAARTHRQGRPHHQSGLLLERHPGDEVGHPLRHWPAPVFVGVERPVLVEVLEERPVHAQHRHDARADLGLRRRPGFERGQREADQDPSHA